MRQSAKRARAAAAAAAVDAPAQLAGNLVTAVSRKSVGAVVSAYLAIGDEIDLGPTMEALIADGHDLALPVVVGQERPLVFRRWRPGDSLEDGPLGTRHPLPDASDVEPDLVLVPLLAFDRAGYRLGWGGGFYDRTLTQMRRSRPVIAVGVAYDAQRVDKVPRDEHDARLDWVATETAVHEITDLA